MNLFETVKTAVNAREAAQLYGVAVNRCGMALCPFHNDHHPSLLVADDHYHCFACGAHGDVIDLAANLFGLSLYLSLIHIWWDTSRTHRFANLAIQELLNCNNKALPKETWLVKEL